MGHWANRTSTIVQQDAQIINELGKIRGGAQRLVHFALAGEAGEQMYAEIEAIMASFRDHPQFGNQVSVLEDAWRELKQTILAYHASFTV